MATGYSDNFLISNLDPSEIAKLHILKECLPAIDPELSIAILRDVDWDVSAAVEELIGPTLPLSLSPEEWPSVNSSRTPSPSWSSAENGNGFTSSSDDNTSRSNSSSSSLSQNTKSSTGSSIQMSETSDLFPESKSKKYQSNTTNPVFRNLIPGLSPELFEKVYEQELKNGANRKVFELLSESNINQRILIIMRGVPGSGKSTLAKLFLSICSSGKIFSADNFFINEIGIYKFRVEGLGRAHEKCQADCLKAMKTNTGPIIIDNTNTTAVEMIPYVQMAVDHDYEIHIAEPTTEWKWNRNILAKKNTHGVPSDKIQVMIKRYQRSVTVEGLKDLARPGSQMSDKRKKPAAPPKVQDIFKPYAAPDKSRDDLPSLFASKLNLSVSVDVEAAAAPTPSKKDESSDWTAEQWREAGYSCGQRIDELREQMYMVKKNSLGSGAIFDHYRTKIQELQQEKDECHQMAQSLIIPPSIFDPVHPQTELDLHRLHVDEAVSVVQKFLHHHEACLRKHGGDYKIVTIIPGKGQNSPDGPRIFPAVLSLVKSLQYDYEIVNPSLAIKVLISRKSRKKQ